MNQPQTDKPTQKPNFDFIVNQPLPEKNKKPKTKLIIIIALATLLVITVVIGLVINTSRNVKPQAAGGEGANSQSVVQSFITAVGEQDYKRAYTYVSPDTDQNITEEFFVSQAGPSLQALDLSSCEVSTQSVALNNAQLDAPVANCKIKNSDQSLFLVFDMKAQGPPLINSFNPRSSL